ncbi:MAG: DUF115 domain-containing protein [Gammaproteobacteria bacterium]|nr:DUF115 domain-containing protein [Gammaproteobacteria bacterium]
MNRIKLKEISIVRVFEFLKRRVSNVILQYIWMRKRANYEDKFAKLKNAYSGQELFIIANGPSLANVDMRVLENKFVMTMNRAYLSFNDWGFVPNFHVCINDLVMEQFRRDLGSINTQCFYSFSGDFDFEKANLHPVFIKNKISDEFSEDFLRYVTSGGTVTFVCLQLAYYMGFSKVYLLGLDHNFVEQGRPNLTETRSADKDLSHYRSDYFPKGIKWQLPDLVRSELAYSLALNKFQKNGRIIMDLTENGKCKVFPKAPLSDVLKNHS